MPRMSADRVSSPLVFVLPYWISCGGAGSSMGQCAQLLQGGRLVRKQQGPQSGNQTVLEHDGDLATVGKLCRLNRQRPTPHANGPTEQTTNLRHGQQVLLERFE